MFLNQVHQIIIKVAKNTYFTLTTTQPIKICLYFNRWIDLDHLVPDESSGTPRSKQKVIIGGQVQVNADENDNNSLESSQFSKDVVASLDSNYFNQES